MNVTTSIVIIFGPIPSGDLVGRMLNHFGCSRLVKGWDGRAQLQGGDLAITDREPPFHAKGAVVLDIAEALRRVTRQRREA